MHPSCSGRKIQVPLITVHIPITRPQPLLHPLSSPPCMLPARRAPKPPLPAPRAAKVKWHLLHGSPVASILAVLPLLPCDKSWTWPIHIPRSPLHRLALGSVGCACPLQPSPCKSACRGSERRPLRWKRKSPRWKAEQKAPNMCEGSSQPPDSAKETEAPEQYFLLL